MKTIAIGIVAAILASTLPGHAQTYRGENRENRQEYRVYKGAVRGELTPQELRNLQRQQQRIDRSQRRATRDGVITYRERARIERQQDRASRNIARKTNNNRTWW